MDKEIRKRLSVKYNGMKQRCYNQKDIEFKNYGARGIGICEEWLASPDAFNEGYSPENCTWITMAEQQANKRSNVFVDIHGEKVTLAEASRIIGVGESTIWMRLHRGSKIDRPKQKPEKPVIRDDGVIFESVKSAAESVGVYDTKVSAVCKGKRRRTGGHSFRYLTIKEAQAALRREQE